MTSPMTFQECVKDYLSTRGNMPTAKEYEWLAKYWFKEWSEWPTYRHISDWHTRHKDKPNTANKGLGFLKSFFFWANRCGYYAGQNPAQGIKRHKTFSRDTVMDQNEIAQVLDVSTQVAAHIGAFLMLTLM